jgi:effector-binding domain-containing protein
MMPAYQTMSSYMKSNNLGDEPELVIEQYITDPMMEKDTAKWQTNIIFFEKTK